MGSSTNLTQPPPLVRQGTFTKDSPTDSSVDPAPSANEASSLEPVGGRRTASRERSVEQEAGRRVQTTKSAPSISANTSQQSSSGAVLKRRTIPQSPSSHSLGGSLGGSLNGEERTGPYVRSLSSGGILSTRVQKSGSAASLTSHSSSSSAATPARRTAAVPKKDAIPSRIASIWKKKDSSVSSGSATSNAKCGDKTGSKVDKQQLGQTQLQKAYPEKQLMTEQALCRSSTFEKLTDVGVESPQPKGTQTQRVLSKPQSSHRTSVPPASIRPAVRPTAFWRKLSEPTSFSRPLPPTTVASKRVFGTGQKVPSTPSPSLSPMASPSLPTGKDGCRPTVLGLKLNGSVPSQVPQSTRGQAAAFAQSPSESKGSSSPASAVVSPFNYKPKTPTTPGGTRSMIPGPMKLAGTPRCPVEQELQVK